MKIKGLWLLLAASVTFNVLFTIGYVGSRSALPRRLGFQNRARLLVKDLDLNTQQQQVFEELLAQTVQERAKIRQQNRPKRQALLAELVKDQPDEQIVQRYVQSDWHKGQRELMVQQMRKFMAVLRPDQRRAFAQALRSRSQGQ